MPDPKIPFFEPAPNQKSKRLRELFRSTKFPSLNDVESLLQSGADPNAPATGVPVTEAPDVGRSLLFVAMKKAIDCNDSDLSEPAKVVAALKAAGAHLKPDETAAGTTAAVLVAVKFGDWKALGKMNAAGIRLAAADDAGRNAFHALAQSRYCDEGVVKMLIDAGTNINGVATRDDGATFTPLSIAVAAGKLETVKLFLKYGADAKAEIKVAGTAKPSAAGTGALRVVSLTDFARELCGGSTSEPAREKIAGRIASAAGA